MELIWLRSYPPGVPATVDVGAYRSIGELFEASVAAYGGARRLRQHGHGDHLLASSIS